MKCVVLLLSLFCLSVGPHVVSVCSQTTSQILLGTWQVITQAGITCDSATCCCFTGPINGYLQNNENYLNGSATGFCRKAAQQDNLVAPSSYVWTGEFLGIDNANFVLSNLTYNNQTGISMTMTTSIPAVTPSKQKCGFQMWQASATGLPTTPVAPPTSNGTAAPPSAYVTQFNGTWYADGATCATSDNTCCCLTNTVTVVMNPTSQTYTINGTASTGCGGSVWEADDFPFPVDAFSATNGYNTPSLFQLADNYTVDYTAGTGGAPNTILFADRTKAACSFKLVSTPPTTPTSTPTPTPTPSGNSTTSPPTTHSEAAGRASCVLGVAVAFLAVFLH